MNRTLVAKHLIRLIGIFLFIAILLQTDFTNVDTIVLNIDLLSLVFLILLVIPIMLLKGLRWFLIVRALELNLTVPDSVEGLCIAQMTGFTLPGSLGDLIRVPFLKCRGNSSDKSILSLFIDAIAAALIPYLVAVIALIEFFNLDTTIVATSILFSFFFISGTYAVYRLVKVILRPWLLQARLRRIKSGGIVGRIVLNIRGSIRLIGISTFILATIVSGFAWFIYSIQGWLLARVLMLDISWYYVALALTLTSMLTTLPISIQGLGIREGTLLLIFGTVLGYDIGTIVIFSIILTAISLTPSIYGLISWLRDPFVKLESASVEDAITQPVEVFLRIQSYEADFDEYTGG